MTRIILFFSLVFILGACNLSGPLFSPDENMTHSRAYEHKSYAYDKKFEVVEGMRRVLRDEVYGFHDRKGNVVIPILYQDAKDFSEGLASVKKKDYYGYINKKGEMVIPFIFDTASSFNSGNANVVINDIPFVIDTDGKCVEDCPDEETMKKNGIK